MHHFFFSLCKLEKRCFFRVLWSQLSRYLFLNNWVLPLSWQIWCSPSQRRWTNVCVTCARQSAERRTFTRRPRRRRRRPRLRHRWAGRPSLPARGTGTRLLRLKGVQGTTTRTSSVSLGTPVCTGLPPVRRRSRVQLAVMRWGQTGGRTAKNSKWVPLDSNNDTFFLRTTSFAYKALTSFRIHPSIYDTFLTSCIFKRHPVLYIHGL